MTTAEDLRAELAMVAKETNSLLEDKEALLYAIGSIELDLANSLREFVATSGRDPREYYPWRTRAKHALRAKTAAVKKIDQRLMDAKLRETRLQMLIYSHESQYRGQDPSELLRAAYHLLMHVIDEAGITLDESQMGLVSTIRLQSGYGVPEGKS